MKTARTPTPTAMGVDISLTESTSTPMTLTPELQIEVRRLLAAILIADYRVDEEVAELDRVS